MQETPQSIWVLVRIHQPSLRKMRFQEEFFLARLVLGRMVIFEPCQMGSKMRDPRRRKKAFDARKNRDMFVNL
jgi:hypothetical protein